MTRRDADASGREHFGFSDGISQRGIRGLTVASDPNKPDEGEPGQDLIASGEFVLGYPPEGAHAAESTTSNPPTQPRILLQTWNGRTMAPIWSFAAYGRTSRASGTSYTTQAAKEKQSVDLFSAKLIGRYQSGTPLEGAENAPEDPGQTDSNTHLEKRQINASRYSTLCGMPGRISAQSRRTATAWTRSSLPHLPNACSAYPAVPSIR
jgi:hypothetical protein